MTTRVSEGRHLEILESEPTLGVPLEFEVYDGSNPATLLAVLEKAHEGQFQLAMGDVGSGSLRLPRTDPKAVHIVGGNLIRAKIRGVVRGAWWVEDPVETLTSPDEGKGEVIEVRGRGPLAYLERAVVYPPVWPPQPAAFVAAASGDNGAGGTSVTCAKPSGVAAGDVLVAFVVVGGGSDVTISTPAGWELVERRDAGNDLAVAVFERIVGAGDPAQWTWHSADSRAASVAIVAVRNASGDATAWAIASDEGNGTAISEPSVNVGLVDGILIGVAATTANTAITPPSGMVEVVDRAAAGRSVEVAYLANVPLGDTGDRTATAGAGGQWVGLSVWLPSSAQREVSFVDETPGGILVALLERAQVRGAIPLLTWDFDAEVDSQANPWPARHTLSFSAGTSLLDVWRHLVSLGLEGEMTPSLRLRAFVDMSRHLEETVVFRKARHLLGDVKRIRRLSDLRTRLLVEGSGGRVVEIADASLEADPKIGRREGYLSLSTSDDPTVLQQAGLAALEAARLDDEARTVPVLHGDGPGDYEPFVDYRLGDWVSLDADGTGELVAHRIVGLTIGQTTGGDYSVELDLNSVALEREARLARLLDNLSRGSSATGSASGLGVGGGGGGAGGGESGKVAVVAGDTAGYLQDKLVGGTGIAKTVSDSPIGKRLVVAADAQAIAKTILSAKGDILTRDATGAIVRLPVGADGQVLKADSSQGTGLVWAAGGGGGIVVEDPYGVQYTPTILKFSRQKLTDLGGGAIEVGKPLPSASLAAIGAYGDECNGASLDPAWTLRNIGSVTATGEAYQMLFDAQGDAMTRAFTDTGQSFEIMVHILDHTHPGGMIGLCALDSGGSGKAFSVYHNPWNTYVWNISGWAYSSTGPSVGSNPSDLSDYWLHFQRSGTNWRGRWSQDGDRWSSWSGTVSDGRTITRIGILRAYTDGGNQTLRIERFVYGSPSIVFP